MLSYSDVRVGRGQRAGACTNLLPNNILLLFYTVCHIANYYSYSTENISNIEAFKIVFKINHDGGTS